MQYTLKELENEDRKSLIKIAREKYGVGFFKYTSRPKMALEIFKQQQARVKKAATEAAPAIPAAVFEMATNNVDDVSAGDLRDAVEAAGGTYAANDNKGELLVKLGNLLE